MQTFNENDLLRLAHVRATAGLPREFWIDRLELNRMVAQARAEATHNLLRSFGRFVGKIVRSFAEWRRYRIAVAELEGLDSRALEDIGIRRSDIPQVAAGLWMPESRNPISGTVTPVAAENENARKIAA